MSFLLLTNILREAGNHCFKRSSGRAAIGRAPRQTLNLTSSCYNLLSHSPVLHACDRSAMRHELLGWPFLPEPQQWALYTEEGRSGEMSGVRCLSPILSNALSHKPYPHLLGTGTAHVCISQSLQENFNKSRLAGLSGDYDSQFWKFVTSDYFIHKPHLLSTAPGWGLWTVGKVMGFK
jgi:hypothetical protein